MKRKYFLIDYTHVRLIHFHFKFLAFHLSNHVKLASVSCLYMENPLLMETPIRLAIVLRKMAFLGSISDSCLKFILKIYIDLVIQVWLNESRDINF